MDELLEKYFDQIRSSEFRSEALSDYSASAYKRGKKLVITIAAQKASLPSFELTIKFAATNLLESMELRLAPVVEKSKAKKGALSKLSAPMALVLAKNKLPKAMIPFTRVLSDYDGVLARLNNESGELKVGCNTFSLLDAESPSPLSYAKTATAAAELIRNDGKKLGFRPSLAKIILQSAEIIGTHALAKDLNPFPSPELESGWSTLAKIAGYADK